MKALDEKHVVVYHGALSFLTVDIFIGNGDGNRGHFAMFRKFAGVKELKHVTNINHVCSEPKSPVGTLPSHFGLFLCGRYLRRKWRPNKEAIVNGSGDPVHFGL